MDDQDDQNDEIKTAFEAWLAEPAYDGRANCNHLNTRTTDACEIAFKAGWDAYALARTTL